MEEEGSTVRVLLNGRPAHGQDHRTALSPEYIYALGPGGPDAQLTGASAFCGCRSGLLQQKPMISMAPSTAWPSS